MMTVEKIIEMAKNKGIEKIQVQTSKSESDCINTFNQTTKEICSDKMDTMNIKCIIDNKMLSFGLEKVSEKIIDNVLDDLLQYAESIDTEEIYLLSSNKNKYVVKEYKHPVVNNTKWKNELFELDKKIKKIDKRIINTGFWYYCDTDTYAIKNSLGLDVEECSQCYGFDCYITCEEAGKQYVEGMGFSAITKEEININEIAEKCANKCLSKIGAKPIDTDEYEIIMDERVVSRLLRRMIQSFVANDVNKNMSALKGKINTKIVSDKITLIEDPNNEKYLEYTQFDGEGEETTYKEIIKDGILTTYLYDLKTSNKAGIKNTGNGFGGLSVRNLYIKPGEHTIEDMIKATKKGILINSVEGIHSGLVIENGDFSLEMSGKYIKDGEIIKPITLMVVSGNFFDMLNTVEMVGDVVDFNASSSRVAGTALKVGKLTVSGI